MNRGRNKESNHNWSNRGSFLSKPRHGWLHPDAQLSPDVGICYGVRVCAAIWVVLEISYEFDKELYLFVL